MIMLPLLWGSGKVDFNNETNRMILQGVFFTVTAVGYMVIQLAVLRVRRANDTGRVQDPGTSSYIKAEDKAADGSISIRQYDHSKLQEVKMQYIMTAAIVTFMHLKWDYTQPLLICSVQLPLQLWDSKAVQVHIFGRDPGPRPWAGANSNNPLAQWAERKKAEGAQQLKKKD